jgi:hypothetical protein
MRRAPKRYRALLATLALSACAPKSSIPTAAPTAAPCRASALPAAPTRSNGPTQSPPAPPELTTAPEPPRSPITTDACFAELVAEGAHVDGEEDSEWETTVRRRLLPQEEAESVAGSLAWSAVEALMARRFERVAALVGPEGLCLRAAKGADCVQLDARAVARCGRSRERSVFPIDSGDDAPAWKTCAQAMDQVFLTRDFRHPSSIHVNCFPHPGRGNNGTSVVQRPAALFVDFHVEEEPWQSLWLVFDRAANGDPDLCAKSSACDNAGRRLYLVEIMAEYWGI